MSAINYDTDGRETDVLSITTAMSRPLGGADIS